MTAEPSNSPAAKQPGSSLTTWLVMAVVAGMVLFWLLFSPSSMQPATEHPAVGQSLARVQLQPLTGTDQPIGQDDLAGKVVLINYWGPWCGYCLREFPHLVELNERYKSRDDFQLLAVSCSPAWQPDLPPQLSEPNLDKLREETEQFLELRDFAMPIYADPNGISRRAVVSTIGWQGYPMTMVLDKQGKIRGVWEGYAPGVERQMEDLVLLLLKEKRVEL